MSKVGATGQGSITRIISDQNKTLDTRPLGPGGVEKQHQTKAGGFNQCYDIDVEVETRHTIQITGVELVQSSVDIFEETNN